MIGKGAPWTRHQTPENRRQVGGVLAKVWSKAAGRPRVEPDFDPMDAFPVDFVPAQRARTQLKALKSMMRQKRPFLDQLRTLSGSRSGGVEKQRTGAIGVNVMIKSYGTSALK